MYVYVNAAISCFWSSTSPYSKGFSGRYQPDLGCFRLRLRLPYSFIVLPHAKVSQHGSSSTPSPSASLLTKAK